MRGLLDFFHVVDLEASVPVDPCTSYADVFTCVGEVAVQFFHGFVEAGGEGGGDGPFGDAGAYAPVAAGFLGVGDALFVDFPGVESCVVEGGGEADA